MTPEGRVKEKLKRLLKQYRCYYFMPVQNGMGKPGLDFHCAHSGFALNIETKAPEKWPTARQIITMREMRASASTVFVVRDDGDLQELELWLQVPVPGYLSVTAVQAISRVQDASTTTDHTLSPPSTPFR